jgi:DNA-binding NtrC family response regulator
MFVRYTHGMPPQARGRETILLVEDDEMLRRVGLRLLLSRGYRVLTACDGEAALALLRDDGKDVDLLLTDVVMPGLSGEELAREALKLKPGLKVIFISGYPEHGAPGTPRAEKYEFLQKPVSLDELARKVREVLDGSLH